jgi:MFS transporter, Spinster family, sphingosine-1-phosphate transporter
MYLRDEKLRHAKDRFSSNEGIKEKSEIALSAKERGRDPYRFYLLGVLTAILAFNYTDRFALGVVLQDIKVDLQLSDAQLGLLSGIAFALFYALMGVPIARLADRGNRVVITAVATATWSIAVALCGASRTFVELMLVRVGVGAGEAGCVPPALSLIADHFDRTERPRAVAAYIQGISISMIIGFFAAGWLTEKFGWRAAFPMIGLPGLALGLLAFFTLKEPRKNSHLVAKALTKRPTAREAWAVVWGSVTFRHLMYAIAIMWFFSYGTMQWTPAFLVRSFGMKPGPLGTWLAAVYGLGNIIGTYWGGEWCMRRARNNEGRQLKMIAIATAISGIFQALVYIPMTAPTYYWAFAWLAIATIASAMSNGPCFSVIQALMPENVRATAFSLVYLFGNLVGLGLGPWLAGVLSDLMVPITGSESLRFSMLLLCPGFIWGAWHMWRGNRTAEREIATLNILE